LAWVKTMLKDYDDIHLDRGFKSESFQNGKVILGLINEYGEGLVDYKSYPSSKHSWAENCKSGLEIAEAKMDIPAIIDYQELAGGQCSEKSMVLYLSLMYNAYKEKNLGMTQEAILRKIKELEERLRILTEENTQLKEALKHMDLTHAQLSSTFKDVSETNHKLVVSRDELSTKYGSLSETYNSDRLRWEQELARLRAEKAKLAENSDSAVTALNEQWDAINASRDKLREEFRKAKEELTKQKEELDSEHRKLQSKLERTTKTKEGLEQILKNAADSHSQTIEILRKHTLQHVADTNVWVPILEVERNYHHIAVDIPKESVLAGKEFDTQLVTLAKVMAEENVSFSKLLKEREVEEAEVLSVNMGKLKKRVKKGDEAVAAQKKNQAAVAASDPSKGKSPRVPDSASPRARPATSAPSDGKPVKKGGKK